MVAVAMVSVNTVVVKISVLVATSAVSSVSTVVVLGRESVCESLGWPVYGRISLSGSYRGNRYSGRRKVGAELAGLHGISLIDETSEQVITVACRTLDEWR